MFVFGIAWGNQAMDGETLFNLTTGYMYLYDIFVLLQFLLLYTLLAKYISRKVLLIR